VTQQRNLAYNRLTSNSIGAETDQKNDSASTEMNTEATHGTNDDDMSVKVREIVNMGFLEESARRCLNDSQGDVEMAVSMLLSEASGSPTRTVDRSETVRIMRSNTSTHAHD
jgi:uncharacterized UBP type Zn finger protein